jgi:hypothetical protein
MWLDILQFSIDYARSNSDLSKFTIPRSILDQYGGIVNLLKSSGIVVEENQSWRYEQEATKI